MKRNKRERENERMKDNEKKLVQRQEIRDEKY
jgi:hypothetical protein